MKVVTELITYCCAECNKNAWTLYVGHRSDGVTELVVSCANPTCQKTKRKELDADDGDLIIWDTFDISGQGHDAEDINRPSDDQLN